MDIRLLEARRHTGGRIQSTTTGHSDSPGVRLDSAVDLGPSWFWPGQERLAQLLTTLGLADEVYPQWSQGDSVIEYADGRLQVGVASASMAGSLRLDGGLQRLTDQLQAELPSDSLITSCRVQRITEAADTVHLDMATADHLDRLSARRVVLALPPRVVESTIAKEPPWSDAERETQRATPTWMAGQAKCIAVYDTPFWRDAGLSGDAFSQRGPLVEIHDASPKSGGPYALFGFVGIPPAQRRGRQADVQRAVVEQITRLFGDAGRHPIALHYRDWADDDLTASELDQSGRNAHAPPTLRYPPLAGGRIWWAGTETAEPGGQEQGYLEGALASAERVANAILTLD